jgi:hypothetical protein
MDKPITTEAWSKKDFYVLVLGIGVGMLIAVIEMLL